MGIKFLPVSLHMVTGQLAHGYKNTNTEILTGVTCVDLNYLHFRVKFYIKSTLAYSKGSPRVLLSYSGSVGRIVQNLGQKCTNR